MKRAIRLRIYDPVGNLIREDHVPEGQSLDIKGERPTSLVIGRITLDPSPPPEPYRSPITRHVPAASTATSRSRAPPISTGGQTSIRRADRTTSMSVRRIMPILLQRM
jgi:hypothetical protein